MAEIIRMPKMSDTMEEGVIASWLKKVGDQVKSGDILAEVETDKATMELESYDDGTLLHIGVKDGDSVPVDGVIAVIGDKNEDVKKILDELDKNKTEEDNPISEVKENETSVDNDETPKVEEKLSDDKLETNKISVDEIIIENKSRIKASPLAKKLAQEKGVNLSNVSGSGEGGRIIKKDIESFSGVQDTDPKSNQKEIALPKNHMMKFLYLK